MLREVCSALGITEEQFTQTHDLIAQSDRCEEMRLALQGQLHDILSQDDSNETSKEAATEQSTPLAISEDVALQIFEVITRQSLEQQSMEEGAEEDPQSDLLNVLVHNAKMMDQIYIEY